MTPHTGEDIVQGEQASIAGGQINLYYHYGYQYDSFSEN